MAVDKQTTKHADVIQQYNLHIDTFTWRYREICLEVEVKASRRQLATLVGQYRDGDRRSRSWRLLLSVRLGVASPSQRRLEEIRKIYFQ